MNKTTYPYYLAIKRIVDLTASILLLVVLLPLMLMVIAFLFIDLKGSPFFTQMRPGMNNKVFKLLKFRTMNNNKDANGQLLPDNLRLTRLGKLIRKLSIDELPQLINVLKGEMSLIGPRPLLVEYLSIYNETQMQRHNVRPGITGWAQTNGRNAISWERKFELDLYYVNNVSLLLDLKIALLTIKKVIKREGINSDDNTTMLKFDGTN